ncbi:MAG: hypothetical protein A2293_16050 [Elusimicrobia bacterium RIFOXYB2_FULL_49_7]|nr:MAG: hypothetical protein A2293_16050 [Elusimicrobia bacterium RIFOXYB2_FULL_49_7]
MEINSLINAVTGNMNLSVTTSLLKKAQDIPAKQINQLIQAMPKASPSPTGVGNRFDVFA